MTRMRIVDHPLHLTLYSDMRFRVRNIFYLRLSSSDVVPFYLYLDERHVNWMSERTLQSVVADLRPLIGPKLEAERYAHYGPGGPANAKRGTVEVHRGDTYQFAYFLRKAEPHSIVLKTRNYVMVNHPVVTQSAPSVDNRGNGGNSRPTKKDRSKDIRKGTKRPRKATSRKKPENKMGKGRLSGAIIIESSEEEAEESSLTDFDNDEDQDETVPTAPRRSTRNKKQRTAYVEISDDDDSNDNFNEDINVQADGVQIKQEVNDDAAALQDSPPGMDANEEELIAEPTLPPDFGFDEDEEEKKSKPELQLSFRSLSMRDRCLCVVVEPWPAIPSRPTPLPDKPEGLRAASLAPSFQRPADRASSIAPSRFSVGPELETDREQTPLPLFLPDPSGRDRSATPAPVRFSSEFASLETIDDAQELIEEEDFGMLAFSQVLNNVSGDRTGAAEEDDEMDGGALYGDADEMRGTLQ